MTEPTQPIPTKQLGLLWCWLSGFVFMAGLILALYQGIQNPAPALRHSAIITTAYTTFALWVGTVALMMQAGRAEWNVFAARFRVARFTYILAVLAYIIHVGVAFHFAHRWRHENAFHHVEVTSGFGPGIFVSYAFSLLWTADAGWLYWKPGRYLSRATWLQLSIHLLIAFIMFQATVVYGHGVGRVGSAVVFAVLLLALLWRWIRRAGDSRHRVLDGYRTR